MNLKNFFEEYYKVISGSIVFVWSLLFISFKSYLDEKGKLKAQISENKKLTEQDEKIKAKYNIELEEIKKNYELEISKRKYQYESKKEQYLKFFRLLDEFAVENNVKTQEKFFPILEEFNKNYLNAALINNKKGETNATTVLSKKTQKLMFDANQDLLRIKQETNTIRLIASDDVLQKLDLLTLAYDRAMEISSKMMSALPTLMLLKNQDKMKENQKETDIAAMVINAIKDDIIILMRNELNEI